MIIILTSAVLVSLVLNASLAFFLLRRRPDKKPPQYTYDAQALLRDLMSGPALLKIDYLDRSEVLLRSPRHT